jgi:hypothetical protein
MEANCSFFKFSLYDPIPHRSHPAKIIFASSAAKKTSKIKKASEVADPLRFASSAALHHPHQQENNKQGTIVVSVIHSFQQQTNHS